MHWKEIELEEVGDIVTGKTPPTRDIDNFGKTYPFITPKDMTGQKYVFETERYLSEKGMKAVKNCLINKNTVCVSCIGSDMGKVVMATKPSVTNQQLNSIKVNNKYNSDFIFYSLHCISEDLRNAAFHSTAVPILNKTQFSKFKIMAPPLPEQRAIAEILSSIDDKIELNNQMNRTLEATAQAIFKQWFVDFGFPFGYADGEPVELQGKPFNSAVGESDKLYKQHPSAPLRERSGNEKKNSDAQRSLSVAEMSEFTAGYKSSGGKMIDSELGPIPEGWTIQSLVAIAHYLNGLPMQKFRPKSDVYIPVIKIRELKAGITENSDKADPNIDPKYVIKDGDVLFSWSGSLFLTLWCGGIGGLNQHLFKVTSEKYPKWFYYLWTEYHLEEFIHIAATKATTMGHIQRTHLEQAMVIVPDETVLSQMTSIMQPIIDKIVINNVVSRNLSTLRDSLLPKLMSGELRVPEEIVKCYEDAGSDA